MFAAIAEHGLHIKAVRASPQMLTLEARLLRARRVMHHRLQSTSGAKSQPA